MLEDFKAYELGIKGASNKEEKDIFIDLLKDEIKEAEGKVDAETQKLIDKLKELYLGAKKKEIPKVEKKPKDENIFQTGSEASKEYKDKNKQVTVFDVMTKTGLKNKELRKAYQKVIDEVNKNSDYSFAQKKSVIVYTVGVKSKTKKNPRAKTTPEQKAKNREKVQNATGKTIEECKEILAKYEALRGKTTQKDKQRVEKLKDEDKIIDGTNVKTADAITETTAKQVPKKIKQEVDAIEKEAEQEAIEQVKKESKKFYLAFFNKKKLEIEADSLYDAKQKAVKQFSVPKSKMGLLAVKLASKQEVKIEEVKKKEVEKIKIEKIEEKVKDMTKDLADKSNELIDAMTNTIKKLSPSKDEAIKFLMDIRNHVDVLLKANKANKFQLGGSVQSYDIAWAGGGRPMPMFKKGGKLKANSMPHSLYKNLTNQDVEVFRNMEYSEEEIKETNDRQGRGSQFANTPVNPFFNTYSKGGKFADGGMVNSNGEHYTYFEYVAKDDYLQDTIYFVKIGINEDEEFGGELVADYDGITIDDIREMFGNQIAQRVANGYGRDYEEGNYRSKVIFVNNGLYKKGGKFADGGIVNKRFLENQTSSYRDRILKSIANHYGTTTSAIKEELYDKDAEMIYEYIGNDRGLRMKVYEDMQNYSKGGKFADGGKMKEYIVKYDHQRFKPSNYEVFQKQKDFELKLMAKDLEEAKMKLRNEHNLNPFYFKFNDIKQYSKGGEVKDEYKDFFKRYEENEDNNYHTENAMMLVSEFGTSDELKRLMEIQQIQEKQGYLTVEQSREQYEIQKPYYRKMFAKGGRTTRAINQDRARLSNEKHEQAYLPKRKGDYTSFEMGGMLREFDTEKEIEVFMMNEYGLTSFEAEVFANDYASKYVFPATEKEVAELYEKLNEPYAKGGRTSRAINQDRARLSNEKHEQAYLPKRKGDYTSFERGGYYGGDGEEWIYPSEEERIDTMVDHWNKQGWAQSSVSKQGDDGDFFDRIGVDSMKVGITSQTGNDVIYYDTNRDSRWTRYAKGGKTDFIQDVVDSPNFREGAFTRKAEARGMSAEAFMNEVLHSPNLFDERTRKQAQFMKNAFNN